MQKRKFYNFARDVTTGERELFIDGDIADDIWFGNECTPQIFKAELFADKGDISLWINSNGGSVFAASQIYTMIRDYQGKVTAKIYGICASAASVIAMAADTILMSPTALIYVHNPMTVAVGNKADLQKSIEFLDEVKESILNAYELKTGLSRAKLSHLMDDETPMNVHKAIALGFCDDVLSEEKKSAEPEKTETPTAESTSKETEDTQEKQQIPENRTTVKSCYARLNLLSGGFLK
jgi:ATP-dependent Clp protease protease subunit